MDKILNEKDLPRFILELQDQYDVYGPMLKGGGTARYSYPTFAIVDGFDDLILDYGTMMGSLKNQLFPDNQEIYQYEKSADDVTLRYIEDIWERKRVFLGVHPCDISALMCLDKVFLEENNQNSIYKTNRNNSIIIGLTCNKPHASCFCIAAGTGPDAESGYDLLMTKIENKYYVKSGTEQGTQLLSAHYFENPTQQEIRLRSDQIEKVRTLFPKLADMAEISAKMPEVNMNEILKEYTNLCFTCGSCNLVCPTCHCFTFIERTNPERTKGSRHLIWDSCHFEKFATMAGNVNLRPDVKSRFQHRILDKLYYDAKRYGKVFCVGCGRCRDFCPGEMSIRDAAKKIQEASRV